MRSYKQHIAPKFIELLKFISLLNHWIDMLDIILGLLAGRKVILSLYPSFPL